MWLSRELEEQIIQEARKVDIARAAVTGLTRRVTSHDSLTFTTPSGVLTDL